MAKKSIFLCESCGYETYKWMGKCPRCDSWDTIREVEKHTETGSTHANPVLLFDEDLSEERIILGIDELDRVLGGGLTRGSSILLGGDPGIGKTTLCFRLASQLAQLGCETLYVSGEESSRQLLARKRRLGLSSDFPLLVTTRLDDILHVASQKKYDFVVIDSIQSVTSNSNNMLAGSIGQIRDVSTRLIRAFKEAETAHVFIGHVTKEGVIAGPKILEHMVDTVLYFEGDRMLPYRMIRAMKNRFGSIDEIGLFQMTQEGLVSAENPSQFFIAGRDHFTSGSALFPSVTGTRPILLEVQSIAPKTNYSNPRRLSLGYDLNRVFILIAILEKALGKNLYDRDVYVNITGGMKVSETAADLAVIASMLSSYRDVSIGRETALFGEVGLTGEVRKAANMDIRVRECARAGVNRIFCPRGVEPVPDVNMISVGNIRELLPFIA